MRGNFSVKFLLLNYYLIATYVVRIALKTLLDLTGNQTFEHHWSRLSKIYWGQPECRLNNTKSKKKAKKMTRVVSVGGEGWVLFWEPWNHLFDCMHQTTLISQVRESPESIFCTHFLLCNGLCNYGCTFFSAKIIYLHFVKMYKDRLRLKTYTL